MRSGDAAQYTRDIRVVQLPMPVNWRMAQHRLALPPGNFKAYLFDCDGTVADSMPLHYLAWSQALGEWGCKFSEERFYELGGVPIVEIIERLGSEQGVEMPIPQVAKRKEELYFEHLPKLQCVPEVLEHIEQEHRRIPFAVVSGSTRDSVEASLRTIGLHALASAGGPEALSAVKSAVEDTDESVQDEAVRTLSNWPNNWPEDGSVGEPLLALARSDRKTSHQMLGLRGYLQ